MQPHDHRDGGRAGPGAGIGHGCQREGAHREGDSVSVDGGQVTLRKQPLKKLKAAYAGLPKSHET